MATYKEIHGVKVQYRESDATAIEGDVWYNSSTGLLKMYSAVGALATGGNLNTGRVSSAPSQNGTQTAALCATGGSTVDVEQYNGITWTEIANVNTARQGGGGSGTTTAALAVGGNGPVLIVEEWDASSWTEVGDLNSAPAETTRAAGTATAAIRVGGYPVVGYTEIWNGTSWTETTDLNTARAAGAATGTSTAANFAGGGYPAKTNVEQWNGSSWTEIADITARTDMAGAGTQDLTLVMGISAPDGGCEFWDGSSWSDVADMATPRIGHSGCGTSSSALTFGGSPAMANTEEFSYAATIQTVAFD